MQLDGLADCLTVSLMCRWWRGIQNHQTDRPCSPAVLSMAVAQGMTCTAYGVGV
jgi:hypothetical protein